MANRGYDVVVDVDAEVNQLRLLAQTPSLTFDRATWAIQISKKTSNSTPQVCLPPVYNESAILIIYRL
jgi:hypothetical protein